MPKKGRRPEPASSGKRARVTRREHGRRGAQVPGGRGPRETATPSRSHRGAEPREARSEPKALSFTKANGLLLVAGLVSLTAGYWLLSRGDITAAPLLLVLGYVVLLPLAIIR